MRPLIVDAFRIRTARVAMLGVLVVVLAVEAAFLFNVVRQERSSALADLADSSRRSIESLFLTHPYPMSDKLLLATTELLLPGTPISGGVFLRDDGSVAGSFGIAPTLYTGLLAPGTQLTEDGRYLDAVWPAKTIGSPYALAVRLDASGADLQADAFADRTLVIGLALTLAIVGAIVGALSRVILLPLARLRRTLGLVPGKTDSIDAEWHELMDAAMRRERAPRLENPDIERRVEERTSELRREIEKRADTEAKLSRLAQMINDASGPMLRIDSEGKVLYANEQARALMAAWGTVPGGILPSRWRDRFVSFLQRGNPGAIEEQIENRWIQFTVVPYADLKIVNVYGFDVTDRPQGTMNTERSSSLAGSSSGSSTTAAIGLAVLSGRPALEERLAQGLAHAANNRSGGMLYFVEFEEFSELAKSVGHEAAVSFLGEIASRLRTTVGLAPAILRLERCLFAIVEDGIHGEPPDTEAATRQAQQLISALNQPFRIAEQTVKTQASIGITAFPSDGENVSQLIRNADMALDHAKSDAPNAFRFFMASTNEIVAQRVHRLHALKRSVNSGALVLHFQPRLDIKSCRIRAAEALVRWPEPDAGLCLPGNFLELAEDGGLMETLGRWALYATCKANKAWQTADLPFIRVAVNVPAALVSGGDLAAIVDDVLRRTELDAAYLEIDVSEAIAAGYTVETVRAFDDLRDLGVSTAIDQFSGGRLPLRDLCAINPHRLKLQPDQVTIVGADPTAGLAVRAAIVLARGIDAEVTAVGAETPEQVDFLHTLNVGELQGRAFSSPLTEDAFKDFIDNFTEATLALPEGLRGSGMTGDFALQRRLI